MPRRNDVRAETKEMSGPYQCSRCSYTNPTYQGMRTHEGICKKRKLEEEAAKADADEAAAGARELAQHVEECHAMLCLLVSTLIPARPPPV